MSAPPTIVRSYVDDDPAMVERQVRSHAAVEEMRLWLDGRGIVAWEIATPKARDDSYPVAMGRYWGKADPLILLDHDVVPTRRHIEELLACPHDWCFVDYALETTPCRRYAFLARPDGPVQVCLDHESGLSCFQVHLGEERWRWGLLGEEWGDQTGTGFLKLSPTFQERVPFSAWQGSYRDVDARMSRAARAAGFRAHIHYPRAEHDHHAPKSRHTPLVLDGRTVPVVRVSDLTEDERAYLLLLG